MRVFRIAAGIALGALLGGFVAVLAPFILAPGNNLVGLVSLLLAPVGVIAGALIGGLYWLQHGDDQAPSRNAGEGARAAARRAAARVLESLKVIVPCAALGAFVSVLVLQLLAQSGFITRTGSAMLDLEYLAIACGVVAGSMGGGVYWWVKTKPRVPDKARSASAGKARTPGSGVAS
jgi:hypothetical protein